MSEPLAFSYVGTRKNATAYICLCFSSAIAGAFRLNVHFFDLRANMPVSRL